MENFTLYKNKGDTFKFQLQVDGAPLDEAKVRLCLEFEDNKNLHFYGTVDADGSCVIAVPRLPEMDNRKGKLVVEAVVDGMYFSLYEGQVDIRNSVEVKAERPVQESRAGSAKAHISGLEKEEPKLHEAKPPEPKQNLQEWLRQKRPAATGNPYVK